MQLRSQIVAKFSDFFTRLKVSRGMGVVCESVFQVQPRTDPTSNILLVGSRYVGWVYTSYECRT